MLDTNKKSVDITPADIDKLLNNNYVKLISGFYEMQSEFLRFRYKIHKSLETSNIVICLAKDVHLTIFRQREKDLKFDVSQNNFYNNTQRVALPAQKIISIVNTTGIPKETVRRKIKKLLDREYIGVNDDKEYYWKLTNKRKDNYLEMMDKNIESMTKFISIFTDCLNLSLSQKAIQNEPLKRSNFSARRFPRRRFYLHVTCSVQFL